MARGKLELDIAGMRELRNRPAVMALLREYAEGVAEAVKASPEVQRNGMDVEVYGATNGSTRARAKVVIAHPGGLALQAKHGTLSRAARAASLGAGKVKRAP